MTLGLQTTSHHVRLQWPTVTQNRPPVALYVEARSEMPGRVPAPVEPPYQRLAPLRKQPLDIRCFSYDPIQLGNIGGNLLDVLIRYVPLT